MGNDNQPKERQKIRDLKRTEAKRHSYPPILIVCEGKKTEPNYLAEIRQMYKLSTANIAVVSSDGTCPTQVVSSARNWFLYGNPQLKIQAKAFEAVYAVFDRDDHIKYHQALKYAQQLDGTMKNNERKKVPFKAIVSIPCFELWFLLHFCNLDHEIHRDEVYKKLKTYLPHYTKGGSGYFKELQSNLKDAIIRSERLRIENTPQNPHAYTNVDQLVERLIKLKDKT